MKINDILKTTIILAIVLVSVSIFYYFVLYLPNNIKNKDISDSAKIDNDLKCAQLYELKKQKYWENELGQSKAIYNKNLDTCLAVNLYNDFSTGKYYSMIMDMSNDSSILYYSSEPKGFYFEGDKKMTCNNNYIYLEYMENQKEIKKYGCDTDENEILTDNFNLFDEMLSKIKSYGFKING